MVPSIDKTVALHSRPEHAGRLDQANRYLQGKEPSVRGAFHDTRGNTRTGVHCTRQGRRSQESR